MYLKALTQNQINRIHQKKTQKIRIKAQKNYKKKPTVKNYVAKDQ